MTCNLGPMRAESKCTGNFPSTPEATVHSANSARSHAKEISNKDANAVMLYWEHDKVKAIWKFTGSPDQSFSSIREKSLCILGHISLIKSW